MGRISATCDIKGPYFAVNKCGLLFVAGLPQRCQWIVYVKLTSTLAKALKFAILTLICTL